MKWTNKEKELFQTWAELFGKDSEGYKKKVDAYFKTKKEVDNFLKGKNGDIKEGLFDN